MKEAIQYLLDRTLSNRPLITDEEQQILYDKKILVIGLSVGSQSTMSLVRSGIGNSYMLVDPDTVELKNLNRTPYFATDIGTKKVTALSKQLQAIDPYLQITTYDRIIDSSELRQLVQSSDLVLDAFDDFKQKVFLRQLAEEYKKPIITGFDIDKGALIIVERHDLGKVDNSVFFNKVTPERITQPASSIQEKIETFISVIGEENHTPAMLEAVRNIGTKYAGIPQLMIATNLMAASWTLAAIDTLLNKRSQSFRAYIDLESTIYR